MLLQLRRLPCYMGARSGRTPCILECIPRQGSFLHSKMHGVLPHLYVSYFTREMAPKTPSEAASMMAPARSTPSIT